MKESTRLTSFLLLPCSDSSSSDILGGIEGSDLFHGSIMLLFRCGGRGGGWRFEVALKFKAKGGGEKVQGGLRSRLEDCTLKLAITKTNTAREERAKGMKSKGTQRKGQGRREERVDVEGRERLSSTREEVKSSLPRRPVSRHFWKRFHSQSLQGVKAGSQCHI